MIDNPKNSNDREDFDSHKELDSTDDIEFKEDPVNDKEAIENDLSRLNVYSEIDDVNDYEGMQKFADRGWWLACSLVITGIATFLRFYKLAEKPFHNDEGVNGYFLANLLRNGIYQYDPANYHGPDLYYFSFVFAKVFGLNDWSVRASVAFVGVLTVVLVFYLRPVIGKYGSLFAALFVAVSPGMVYISRYFIHEMYFVFFSLAIVVAIFLFIKRERAGFFALFWMALILVVSMLPAVMRLLNQIKLLADEPATWLTLLVGALVMAFVIFVMFLLKKWDRGRPIYLMLASASVIMLFATKETGFITIGTMLIACGCVVLWRWIQVRKLILENRSIFLSVTSGIALIAVVGAGIIFQSRVYSFYTWFRWVFSQEGAPDQKILFFTIIGLAIVAFVGWGIYFFHNFRKPYEVDGDTGFFEPTLREFRNAFGVHPFVLIGVCFLVFVYLGVLFFSSFFTYSSGVWAAFEAYAIWTRTGSADHTQNGTIAYVKWLIQLESPIVVLSILGSVIAVFRGRERFPLFTALWAFGLFLAYTIIPYKTPWLALSFTLPMCIVAGYAIEMLIRERFFVQDLIAVALAGISTFVLLFQTHDLSFLRYDSDKLPYVYAHTERGFLDLVRKIDSFSEGNKMGKLTSVNVTASDYWSLPWYTRDYTRFYYGGKMLESSDTELIVAAKKQRQEVIENFSENYSFLGEYPLRPGVSLLLLVRDDVAPYDAKPLSEIPK